MEIVLFTAKDAMKNCLIILNALLNLAWVMIFAQAIQLEDLNALNRRLTP